MVKKGDTLVEVTLAVGIFSMVAIAIVAVLNGSTSGAQTALEATLAREEIDAQAEALRFIQASYIADHNSADPNQSQSVYSQLWKTITQYAKEPQDTSVTYMPDRCQSLYDKKSGDVFANNGFIINTHILGSSDPSNAFILAKDSGDGTFIPTPTYPHLVYGNNLADNDDTAGLVGKNSTRFLSANGIYVIAVKDDIKTSVVDAEGNVNKNSAFYDFYIRACWYGTDANEPSTISTVIRLYDPDAVQSASQNNNLLWGEVTAKYHFSDTATSSRTSRKPIRLELPPEKEGYKFIGYCKYKKDCSTSDRILYNSNDNFTISNDNPEVPITVDLYPIWVKKYSTKFYDLDGRLLCTKYYDIYPTIALQNCGNATPRPQGGQEFQGWSPGINEKTIFDGNIFNFNQAIDLTKVTYYNAEDRSVNLFPAWRTIVVFNGNEWRPSGTDSSENNCTVFNFNRPSSGTYCAVTKGSSSCKSGSTTLRYSFPAPADGYLVSGGRHIETYSSGINLQGYCRSSADEGVYYEIGSDDTFELSAKMNTAGMSSHPGGYASISIGPLTSQINNDGITYKCQSSSKSTSFSANSIVGLKITKYGDVYSLTVNNSLLGSCTVPNYNSGGNINVKYSMFHYSHSCSTVFNVQLTDIEMKRVIKD